MRSFQSDKRKYKEKAFLFGAALFLMLICAGFTSPLYPHYLGLDCSMFLTTAKGLLHGKALYLDLFDHKGPVFFWLEAIGYSFGGRSGVWLFQCFLFYIDLLLVAAICKKIQGSSLIGVVTYSALFLYTFQHGNLTEEFSLPFLLLGCYYAVTFLLSAQPKHPVCYAFLYGILFGIIAFMRVNNAALLCSLALCIGILLISEKEWKNLFANIVAGIAGIAVAALPICFYFYSRGTLSDMLYATFLHNLIYAKEKTHQAVFSACFLAQFVRFLPGFAAVAVFWSKHKQNKRLYLSLLSSTILVYGMLFYTNIYLHYFMLAIPLFAIAASSIFSNVSFFNCFRHLSLSNLLLPGVKRLSAAILAIIILYCGLSVYSACAPIYKTYLSDIASAQYEQISQSVSVIPDDERNSVICYGVLPDFYVHADIVPCYKYYTLQEWMTTEKRNVYGEFIDYLEQEHPLWIITSISSGNEDILRILQSYQLVTSDDYCDYYHYIG